MFLRITRSILIALTAVTAACSHGSTSPVLPQQQPLAQSISPGSISPPPMAHTMPQPAGVMNVKPQSAVQDASWTQIPGAATSVEVAPDDSVWALSTLPAGPDKYIWHYAGGAWSNITGLATRLSTGPDGTLYAINSAGGAYAYKDGAWTALGGGSTDIAGAADGSVYVLSNGGAAGTDQAIWHNVAGVWSQTPGSGVRITASHDQRNYNVPAGNILAGGVYIVNSAGAIYYLNPGGNFVQIPGTASQVDGAPNGGLFALEYPASAGGNDIYYCDLTAGTWTDQPGSAVAISVGADTMYAVSSSGAIYTTRCGPNLD